MRREEVKYLYFITAITNVPSIVEHGLLSHNRARRLPHVDISMQSVHDIRARKRVPGGQVLHDYACLYLCPRNPMLYKRALTMEDELCVLAFDDTVLDLPDVVISDHNAAAGVAAFGPYPEGLEAVNRSLTFAKYWNHEGDPMATERHRKRMCAEVLVPDSVEPRFIRGAFVANDTAKSNFEALGVGLKVVVEPRMFF